MAVTGSVRPMSSALRHARQGASRHGSKQAAVQPTTTERLRFQVSKAAVSAPPDQITLRRANVTDDGAIMQAFNATFNVERNCDYWRWKFARDSRTSMIIAVDEIGRVHAQFGVAPIRYRAARGGNILGGLGADAFAVRRAADVQARLFIKTVRLFFTPAGCLHDHHFTFGFPNDAAYGIYRHTVPLRYDFQLSLYSRQITDERLSFLASDAVPTPAAVDDLWQRIGSKYSFSAVKDSEWFGWRFLQNPSASYGFVTVDRQEGGLAAWAAVRKVGKTLVLVDLTIDPDDYLAAKRLDTALLKRAANGGCNAILGILPDWFVPLFAKIEPGATSQGLGRTQPGWERATDVMPIRFVLSDHHSVVFEMGTTPWFSFADSDLY